MKAITYCDLWVLSRENFSHILKRFPKFSNYVDEQKPKNPLNAAPAMDAVGPEIRTESKADLHKTKADPMAHSTTHSTSHPTQLSRLKALLQSVTANKQQLQRALKAAKRVDEQT